MTPERQPAVDTPRPRDVDGYAQARANGVTPPVTPTPPAVTVQPPARDALRAVAAVGATVVVSLVAALLFWGRSGRLPWVGVGFVVGVGVLGAVALSAAVRRWGRSQLAELQAGYTTATFTMGRFWFASAPGGPVTNGWVEWDWSATWVLAPDGSVRSMPSRDGDPPGLYPSPRRAGALELWTGHQWSGWFPPQASGGRAYDGAAADRRDAPG